MSLYNNVEHIGPTNTAPFMCMQLLTPEITGLPLTYSLFSTREETDTKIYISKAFIDSYTAHFKFWFAAEAYTA